MSRRSRKTTHAWRRLTPCSRRHTGSRQRARKSNHAALRSAHRSALRQGQWSDGHDPQRRRDLHHPVLHLQLQRLGEWKDSAMSETTPTPWAIRPNRFDDWGYIRGADGETACIARGHSDKSFDEHRKDKTDPYEPNARLIVEAVNNH